jgi:Na+-translocating ferredoxin:NAD+ oxidoreductase RnfC subunit
MKHRLPSADYPKSYKIPQGTHTSKIKYPVFNQDKIKLNQYFVFVVNKALVCYCYASLSGTITGASFTLAY